jgi:hypothetical protein
MKIYTMRVYPPLWRFRWIKNYVAGGPVRGFSLYYGSRQIAIEFR